MLSTAKTKSVISITTKATKSGVASLTQFSIVKNFEPSNL
jgi:hypothetical protein